MRTVLRSPGREDLGLVGRRAGPAAAFPAGSGGRGGQYYAFADDFVRGMKRMREGLEVYKHLLRTFTGAMTEELLEGIDSGELLERIGRTRANGSIRQSDLTQALDRVDRLKRRSACDRPY